MSCHRGGDSLLYLCLGGMIGAGIALLYAPKSGRETREDIMNFANQGAEKVISEKSLVQHRLSELMNQINIKTEELIRGGVQMADEKKREILSAIQAAKRAFDEERQKFEEERETY